MTDQQSDSGDSVMLYETLRDAPSPLYISTAGPERGAAIYSQWWSGARKAALKAIEEADRILTVRSVSE